MEIHKLLFVLPDSGTSFIYILSHYLFGLGRSLFNVAKTFFFNDLYDLKVDLGFINTAHILNKLIRVLYTIRWSKLSWVLGFLMYHQLLLCINIKIMLC